MEKLYAKGNGFYIRLVILSAILLVASSWYRVYMAGTLAVDNHGLVGAPAIILFILFIASLVSFCYSYYQIWKRAGPDVSSVRPLVYILVFIFLSMAPMLSSDVFSYLTFGDTSNKGIDVFTDSNHLYLSSYYSYVSDLYLHIPCVYGPVSLLMFKISAWLGGTSVVKAYIVYKIIILFYAIAFVELAFRVNALLKVSSAPLLFLLINPVFLMQGIGQVHPDLIASVFVLAAVYTLLADKWYLAFALVITATAVKLNYILMFPFVWGGAFFMSSGSKAITRAIAGPIISVVVLALIYLPVFTSLTTFTAPFLYQFTQTPTKSIAQVSGEAIYFVYDFVHHNTEELSNNLNNKNFLPPLLAQLWKITTKVMQVIAMLTSLFILYKFITGERSINRWMKVYVRLLLVFLLLYTHIFYSWYLMMFLPFIWGVEDTADIKWLIVLTGIVQIQDLTVALSRETTVRFIAIAISYLCVIVYIWRFRSFFINFDTKSTQTNISAT